MRAKEFTTATGQDILRYVKSQHHDYHNDQDVLEYPRWRLENTPLDRLIIDDPDRDDPLGRVLDIDPDQVDRIVRRGVQDIANRPIVADVSGAIIDGNHRAVAAREMGLKTIPAWRPVEDLDEALHFVRAGELRGSYTDQDMARMGFRRAQNGAWYIDQARWERLVSAGQLREQRRQRPHNDLIHAVLDVVPDALEIWLHGSRATGKHRGDSDTDILVVVPGNIVGYDYVDIVLTLQKLNDQFGNYDIQPTHPQNNIHKIAQEEGQLLWNRDQRESLQERVSSTLYHYTNVHAGSKIMQQGQFELTSALGTNVEQQWAPPGYPYYLSATRTRTGGYHDYVGSSAVMMVLDGNWFNTRYPGKAVDYWGNRAPAQMYHRAHEAEDRIFSREPTIPVGGVKAVHVLVKPDAESSHRGWARQLILAAKQRGIATYLYSDEQAWRGLDTRQTVPVNMLRGEIGGRDRGTRGHRGYLMPWMELLFGKNQARLSKRADSIRYNLNYGWDRDEALKSLATDLANARKPNSGPDREHAVKIIDLMRREGLQTLADLVAWTRARWATKAVSEDRDPPAAKIQQAVLDFYDQHTPDQAPVPDYVDQARELLRQAPPSVRDRVLEILKKGRKNPYIQGGVITAVGAILAGAALTSAQRMGLTPTQTNMLLQALLNTVIPTMVSRVNGRDWRDTIKYTLASMGVGTGIAALTERGIDENFADGKKPGRKGLSRRVGIPKKSTLAQLEKIAGSSTGERRRMAQWQLNMRRGRARKNK